MRELLKITVRRFYRKDSLECLLIHPYDDVRSMQLIFYSYVAEKIRPVSSNNRPEMTIAICLALPPMNTTLVLRNQTYHYPILQQK
jgi:hypothetical protein